MAAKKHTIKQLRLIWAIFLLIQLGFLGVGMFLTEGVSQGFPEVLPYGLVILGLVNLAFGWIVPKYMGRGGTVERIDSEGLDPQRFVTLVVQYSLFEFASLTGFVATLMTAKSGFVLLTSVLAILSMLLNAPKATVSH